MNSINNLGVKIGLVVIIVIISLLTFAHQNREYDYYEFYDINFHSYYREIDNPDTGWVDRNTYYMPYGDMAFYLLPLLSLVFVGMLAYIESKEINISNSSKYKFTGYMIIALFVILLTFFIDRNMSDNGGILNVSLNENVNSIHLFLNAVIILSGLVYSIRKSNYSLTVSMGISSLMVVVTFLLVSYQIYWFIMFLYFLVLITNLSLIYSDMKKDII